ncbi:MAG: hypothetical protein HPY82_14790 [Gammaproteobacteria bacterium]|nr:hypothetical protein [Gammaproteobacteria bacterium]
MFSSVPSIAIKSLAVVLLASIPLVGGCGDGSDKPNGSDDVSNPPTDDVQARRYLPYSIRFNLDGTPVIVDEQGKVVELVEAKPPFKATALVGVQTVSVVTYTGSCKQIYNIGGKLYEITLPDGYCKSL